MPGTLSDGLREGVMSQLVVYTGDRGVTAFQEQEHAESTKNLAGSAG